MNAEAKAVSPKGAEIQPRPPSLTPSKGRGATRLCGLLFLALGTLALLVFTRKVFALDFGTSNQRLLGLLRGASLLLPAYPALLGAWALLSGRPPRPAFNPLGLPFQGWWYAALGTLTWRELRRFFQHPVAYVILFVFLCINGFLFHLLLEAYAGPRNFGQDFQQPASFYVTDNGFLWFSLILICPALTMRLLAEEQRSGTLELLLTAPLSDIQVVLSKFLAALAYFTFMVGLTLLYLAVLRPFAPEWDWGPVWGGYLGLFLAGGLFLSIGVFASSLTQSQIIAYLLAALPLFALILVVNQVQAQAEPGWVASLAEHLNIMGHQHRLASGIIHWKTLVFYLSSTLFFLFLAVRGLESHRWR